MLQSCKKASDAFLSPLAPALPMHDAQQQRQSKERQLMGDPAHTHTNLKLCPIYVPIGRSGCKDVHQVES